MAKVGTYGVKRAGAFVALALALFFGSWSPAFAWDLGKSTNGVVINREPSDTSTATVVVSLYYDYKGGASWVSSYTPSYTSSYNTTRWICNIDGVDADALEVDLQPGYRCQMVQVAQGSTYRKFAVLYEPLKVSVENTSVPARLTTTASVTGTVSVSAMPTTMSVSGTLPVDIASFLGDSTSPLALRLGVLGVCFAGGVASVRGWRRAVV